MRRIFAPVALLGLLAPLAFAIGGCELATIRPPGGGGGDGGPPQDPETFFDSNVQPILSSECSGCHEGQRGTEIQFLDPGRYYDSVTTFVTTDSMTLFIPGDPDNSKIIAHLQGAHSGGPYGDGSEAVVRTWINLEGNGPGPMVDAGPSMTAPVQSAPRLIVDGMENRISLNTGTIALTGAFLVFDAAFNGTDLIMTNIGIEAGSRGISVTRPLLFIWEDGASTGTEDPNASRFGAAQNFQVDAATRAPLSDREVVPNFPTGGSLSVQFDTVQYMN